MKTLRIFISSPSDVLSERARTLGVIQKLQIKYRTFINLEPILWEHEAVNPFASFQPQIIPPSKTDLFICILWMRVGLKLDSSYQRPDGTIPTGMEWEFEDACKAQRAKGTPDLFVYRKTAKPVTQSSNDEDLIEGHEQKKTLEGFFKRCFEDSDGSFKAAFNRFESEDEFERMLISHLEHFVKNKLCSDNVGSREV